MSQFRLLVGRATDAALQTVGLIGVEVRDRTYLQPALLCLAVHLKVVADGRCEALVTATQAQDAVGQFQLLQQSLHVLQHLLVALLRVLWCVDAYDLHLRELMQTVQATHVLAIRTRLTTEALCVGTVLDGQVLFGDDDIAVDVRHGHFSRGDEVEVVHLAVVHLTLLVGQLTRAVTAGLVHHCWGHYLLVSSSTSLVEEEVDECSLQAGSPTAIYGESCTSDLHAQVEVDEVIFLGELPVGQGIGDAQFRVYIPISNCITLRAFLEVRLYHAIVFCSSAFRNFLVGDIGYLTEQVCHLILCLSHCLVELL